MKKKRGNTKGQMKLSFGMIFSIILIIVFIAFAFYAINFFLDMQENVSSKKLITDIQKDVDSVWRSSESSQTFEYTLPKNVDALCFVDWSLEASSGNEDIHSEIEAGTLQEGNVVLYEESETRVNMETFGIEHINLQRIISSENPYCIRKIDGKVNLVLKKGFQDALVDVERV